MTLAKTLKNLCSNHMVILTVVAALVLIYFVNNYSAQKGIIQSGMSNGPFVTNNVLDARNAANVPELIL